MSIYIIMIEHYRCDVEADTQK